MSENAIAVSKDRKIGSFYTSLQNFEDGQRVGNMISQSSMIPAAYKNSLANCMIALEYAAKMKVSPTDIMQNLIEIKGNLGWKATFIISMVNGCGMYSRLKFKVENKGDNQNMSCYAYATELETGEVLESTTITMAMARGEGWTNNKKWQNMPEQMLKYRSAAFFSREHCPELFNGIGSSEEVEDFTKDSPLDNIPTFDPSDYQTIDEDFEDVQDIPEAKTVIIEDMQEVKESVIIEEEPIVKQPDEQLNMFEQKAKKLEEQKGTGCGF